VLQIERPSVVSLDQILPDEPLLMMGAGPVPIPAAVARANSLVINHLGPTMGAVIRQVKSMAQYVFQTRSPYILGVAGPGSAAMEMAVANLVEAGTRVLTIRQGYFSGRLGEMARRVGGVVEEFDVALEQVATVEAVLAAVDKHEAQVVTLVQGETSNTTSTPHLAEICRRLAARGCYVIVDAVCTLSTMPFFMDDWGIDAVITGGQKGLSSIPGVSLVAFSQRAFERIRARQSNLAHWCLDARLAQGFWGEGQYHYTASTSGVLALHEALRLVCNETLEARFARHKLCSEALQAGVEALGLRLYAPRACRLNSVVGIVMPTDVDGNRVRQHMSDVHRVEISGSFGLPIVRIGQMGEQSRSANLFRTLHALGSSIRAHGGRAVDVPAGMSALEKRLCLAPEEATA